MVADRWFLIQLYRWFPSILRDLTIIWPETLVRWHGAGFRCYWRWKSRPLGGRPQIDTELLAPDSLLNTYESERKPDVRSYVEGSDSLGAMIFTRDSAAAAERDRNILSRRTASPAEERSISSGILYCADGTRLPTGCLGPQGIVQSSRGEGRFDEIAGAGFQLIGWQIDPANFLNVEQLEFLRAIGAVVCGITDEVTGDGLLVDIEGAYQSFCRHYGIIGMIQRPDFIIFGTAQDPRELSFLVDELRQQLSGGV